ncbi:hypothetical protein LSAT2_000209 [Lamellibrachia satsuma]|nr:hypothetical protein LSAT2_000209 [Lamellibrachia satsuma]
MATRDGCRKGSETVRSSKVFAVVVLVMMLVVTTASGSMIPACIKRCKERHNNCFDLCMTELITDPTKREFCHGFCHFVTHSCIVACHKTKGIMP